MVLISSSAFHFLHYFVKAHSFNDELLQWSFKGSLFNDYVVKFSTDPKDFNPLFDVKEFSSAQFQRVYQYLKLSEEGKNMDNFTFVPGNIDDDKKTCLSLLLRFVIKTVNSLEATAFFGSFISKLIFVSSWYISWILQLIDLLHIHAFYHTLLSVANYRNFALSRSRLEMHGVKC